MHLCGPGTEKCNEKYEFSYKEYLENKTEVFFVDCGWISGYRYERMW